MSWLLAEDGYVRASFFVLFHCVILESLSPFFTLTFKHEKRETVTARNCHISMWDGFSMFSYLPKPIWDSAVDPSLRALLSYIHPSFLF